MKYEEAIKAIKIKEMKIECKADRYAEFLEGLILAREALEKQIPKKVGKRNIVSYGLPHYCPECEAGLILVEFFNADGSEPEEKVSYCWQCGQAIDWSE